MSQTLCLETPAVAKAAGSLAKLSRPSCSGICHRELGNHAEALKTYRRCRELLSIVLGVQPTAETQAVYQSPKQNSEPITAPGQMDVVPVRRALGKAA